jgi:hypothetical protein
VALAPLAQRGEDREEFPNRGGGQVLIARGAVAVPPAFDDPGFLELVQPQREGLSRSTGADLDVLESVDTETQLPKNGTVVRLYARGWQARSPASRIKLATRPTLQGCPSRFSCAATRRHP